MPHTSSPPALISFASNAELSKALSEFILKAQKEALGKKGRFTIALSGGSLPKQLGELIGNPAIRWDKWQVYYADERVVPLDHEDSNHKLCMDVLFSKVKIPSENIHHIDTSLLDDLEELADSYERQLILEFASKDSARFPVFDLILLGLGPDGHTASLFPGHSLLVEEDRWVAHLDDSPKPPPKRITLTYPVINHASKVAFVATGESKQTILAEIMDDPAVNSFPASRVQPVHGKLYWFVDDAASAKVKYPKTPFQL